jgi:hypothetical protein
MAITFIQQPLTGSIQSSDNPLAYVFSGSNYAQPNFSFVVDVLLNGVIIATHKVLPERGNKGHIDASADISIVTLPNSRPSSDISVQTLPSLSIRVSERYGSTPTTQPFSTSDVCKIMKACCPEDKYALNWLEDTYTPSSKWLTDAPDNTLFLSRAYPIHSSILNVDAQVAIQVIMYTQIASHVYDSAQISGADKVNVEITPSILSSALPIGVTLEDVLRLEIYMNQSEALYVEYITEECGEFNQINWMNNIGSYDQFLFTHNRDAESAITMLDYKKQFGAWNTGNEFVYDALNSGDTVYLKKMQPSGVLYSGWISDQYRNWLNQIFYSVDHIVYNSEGVERIVVTDSKARETDSRFEDLVNIEVSYKKSNYKSITR